MIEYDCFFPFQELESVNVAIAKATIDGKLDANPFVQGLLLKLLSKLDKTSRGVDERGRKASCSETERRLIESAAFSFALMGGNREMALELGQCITPPKLRVDRLPALGLPNPALALRAEATDQLQSNLELIDQRYARGPLKTQRRLILGLDHTYVDKTLSQAFVCGMRGLVGGAWHPAKEGEEMIPFAKMTKESALTPKAPLMLETLLWVFVSNATLPQECQCLWQLAVRQRTAATMVRLNLGSARCHI